MKAPFVKSVTIIKIQLTQHIFVRAESDSTALFIPELQMGQNPVMGLNLNSGSTSEPIYLSWSPHANNYKNSV